jgi:hypothetical protein
MTVDVGDAGAVSGDSANPSGQSVTMFTQDQVNHFNAQAKRNALTAYFKELGLDNALSAEDMKGILGKATEFDKQQQGQKGDVERLTGELAASKAVAEKVPGLEVALQRAQIAADAGVKSRYWKYIEGNTPEEIEESVKAVLADMGGGGSDDGDTGDQGTPPAPPQGAGRRPEPNPQQGRVGGQPPTKTMMTGAEAYKAKHKKE